MEEYYKAISEELKAISGSKVRSIRSWMTKYRIYVQQLDKPEDWLRLMGSHAELLLPVAARHVPTCQLLDETQQTPSGKHLGRKEFCRVVDDIEERVRLARTTDYNWTVHDTKRVVEEILGNAGIKVSKKYTARWVGDKVKIDEVTYFVEDGEDQFIYEPGDIIPLEHFERIVGGGSVEGLGEDWRE